jgi:hypothetical protein
LIVCINAYNKEHPRNNAKYIGLDVHQATISVEVPDSAGKLVMEAILETKAERFSSLFVACAAVCT